VSDFEQQPPVGGWAPSGQPGQSGQPDNAGQAWQGQPEQGDQAGQAQGNPYAHPGQYAQQGWSQQGYPGYQQTGQWAQAPFPQPPYQQAPYQQQPHRKQGRSLALSLGAIGLAVVVGLGLGHFAWPAGTSAQAGNQDFGSVAPSNGTSSTAINPSAVAAKVDPALVDVNTVLGLEGAAAAGTGIVLTADGEILTNNHVVEGATSIKVTDIGNGKTYTASVIGYDRSEDVAVIKLANASGLTTASLAQSSSVKVGDAVVGIGNAGGAGGTPSAAAGKVTALNQSITASDESSSSSEQLTGLIQVDADIQAGDSGGALVNSAGQVIGMDTAASTGFQFGRGQGQGGLGQGGQGGLGQGGTGDSGGLGQGDQGDQGGDSGDSGQQQAGGNQGFAIPVDQALTLAHQIVAGTASDKIHIGATAFLGVSVSDPGQSQDGSGTQGGQDSPAGQGAQIVKVVAGDPAEKAGLAAGDVITAVNGTAVDSATTLTTVMDTHHPGDKLTLTVTTSAGQQQSVTVTPTEGPIG
jgi:S1-C subfamily serine protease